MTRASTLRGRGGLIQGLQHPLLWFGVATIVLILVGQHFWLKLNSDLLPEGQFRVQPDQVVINEPSAWVDTEPRLYLQASFSENSYSLLQPDMVSRLADEAELWPFVDSVQQISKRASGVALTLNYRRPVAVVELAGTRNRLVDADAVVIPGWFVEQGADRGEFRNHNGKVVEMDGPWLRINVPNPIPSEVDDWTVWPDSRIAAAAKVTEQVRDVIDEFGFFRVVTFRAHDLVRERIPYEIWTAIGGIVVWSDDPQKETPQSCRKKLQAIRNWINENGSLDQLAKWKKLDVRSGSVELVPETQNMAELPFWDHPLR